MLDDDSAAEAFDRRNQAWADWQGSPWGRLRYRLAHHTLTRAVATLPGPLRVLDVGGGDGADSLPLAGLGHHVTILDYSASLLAAAAEAAEAAGLSERLRTVHADLAELPGPEAVDVRSGFDLVLCHNVLHYRSDVEATVARLASVVRPGGLLSVMAPNPAMDVLAAAVRRTEPAEAAELLDAATIRGATFDREVQRLEAETVEAALTSVGCRVDHRFGLRCVMDLIADDERKSQATFYAAIERLELLLCDREPYWRTARFWQLVATASSGAG